MIAALNLDPTALIVTLGLFLLGGVVKGGLGFGLPLMTMSILPLLMPVEAALALNAVVLPFTNIQQILEERAFKQTVVRFRLVLLGLTVGIPLGAAFVSYVDEASLMASLGVFVVVFCLLAAFAPPFTISTTMERRIAVWVGMAIGVVGSLTTASGPVFVMYLVGLGVERGLFRSALGFMFMFTGFLIIASFFVLGILDGPRFVLGLLCVVPSMIGLWFGNRFAQRLTSAGFRRMVLLGLAVLGANLIYRGLVNG